MITAGLNLKIIREEPTYTLFEHIYSRFGQYGGILLTEYTKPVDTSEDGFNIYAYQTFIQNTNPRTPNAFLDSFNLTMWQLTEVDSSGNVTPWYRTFTDSIQSSFPIPYASFVSKAFVEVRYSGEISSIKSSIKLHLLNNDR